MIIRLTLYKLPPIGEPRERENDAGAGAGYVHHKHWARLNPLCVYGGRPHGQKALFSVPPSRSNQRSPWFRSPKEFLFWRMRPSISFEYDGERQSCESEPGLLLIPGCSWNSGSVAPQIVNEPCDFIAAGFSFIYADTEHRRELNIHVQGPPAKFAVAWPAH